MMPAAHDGSIPLWYADYPHFSSWYFSSSNDRQQMNRRVTMPHSISGNLDSNYLNNINFDKRYMTVRSLSCIAHPSSIYHISRFFFIWPDIATTASSAFIHQRMPVVCANSIPLAIKKCHATSFRLR